MVAANNNLFIDDTEITVSDWYVFMYSVVNEAPDYGDADPVSIDLMPDTTVLHPFILQVFRNASRGINNEYEGPNYNEKEIYSYRIASYSRFVVPKNVTVPKEVWDYPITGISFEQAKSYVLWRNAQLQSMKKEKDKWTIRLATPAEWESIARGAYEASLAKAKDANVRADLTKVYEGNGRNSKGCLLLAVINDNPCESDKKYMVKSQGGLFPSTAFFANQFGAYCMQGNVSEMTSEKGIGMGGNYSLKVEQARFNSKQEYKKPESWLGFRCIAEKRK
jgi:Uncharacterized conserved protein